MGPERSAVRALGIRRRWTLRRVMAKGRCYMKAEPLKVLQREIQHQIRLNKVVRDRNL